MEWMPELELGWLNGWLLLVAYAVAFGGTILSFPKDVVARLYDRSNWSRVQRIVTRIGRFLSLSCFILIILTPLKVGETVFWLGLVMFALGMAGVVVALLNFEAHQPATGGLYKISRNPQWVMLLTAFLGGCIAIGSGIAVLLMVAAAVCYHFRILGEEQACLIQYGESYRAYMRQVPRYFAFF
jgi:protein-S-isoprenylcysteine O-methyltransferase Ste14